MSKKYPVEGQYADQHSDARAVTQTMEKGKPCQVAQERGRQGQIRPTVIAEIETDKATMEVEGGR